MKTSALEPLWCPWEERVSNLVDGELDTAIAIMEVRHHLAECATCQRWLGVVLQLEALGENYLREEQRRAAERRAFSLAAVGMTLALGALGAVLVWWWAS